MSDIRVILITGVSGYWGSRVAARLLAEPELPLHVIGLDTEPPGVELDGLDYVQADLRNPLLPDLLRSEGVDAVCHLSFLETMSAGEAVFNYNVMGTMKVVGAAAESGVRQVVWKSSTMVYGAHPDNSAFLAEDSALRGSRRYGYNRYRLEIESFINGFRRQMPELALTVLRFANVVGPTVKSPMARYLRQPVAPMLLGFDPLLQMIHEDDVVDALVHTLLTGADGCFNVAADPPMPLLRILALAGKLPLPVPSPLAYRLRDSRLRGRLPMEPDYLRYRWVSDLGKMRDELGFIPRYTGDEAVEAITVHLRMKQYKPGEQDVAYDEERLRATIERRRQQRARQTDGNGQGGASQEIERER